MPSIPLTFGVQSRPGAWGYDGDNRLINAYAEDMGEEGKIRFPIRPSPGLKRFGLAPNGLGIRGVIPVNGSLYTIAGTALFRVDTGGTFVDAVGGIPGTSLASMARNRRAPNPEVAIVVDGTRHILTADPLNPTLTPISDEDLPPPIAVTFIDGYFLYAIADGRVFVSGIEDGGNINPLAFFTAEGSPDGLVTIEARSREAFLFGQESIEVWANDGSNNPAPFSRSLGEFIEIGCGSRTSVVKFRQSLAFVDNFGQVRYINGYSPQIISNASVERSIEDTDDPTTISALTYKMPGAEILQLSGPDWTWEFNSRTTFWNERQSWRQERYRASVATQFAGKRILGDVANGKLYEVDRKTYDDDGDPLIFTVRAPIQQNYPGRLEFNEFFADLIPGVGLNETDPALSDPTAMLRYSDDGANSWSNERQLALGKIGERFQRISTTRLGECGLAGRIWELSISAAVSRGLMGASTDVNQLPP